MGSKMKLVSRTSPWQTCYTENTDIVYPSGVALVLLTLGLCMTTFVVSLDTFAAQIACPNLTWEQGCSG